MKISLSDFNFKFVGHGHYLVTYTTPNRGLKYGKVITDMTIVDKVKNNDDVKQNDFKVLINAIKR